ncbi:uncharacterized protein BO72DRAFT_170975 [Aspergillus fijiensis CBS 313.89]|uniref:Rhodopsin domain-containing protein n=1 Tax=Aspergillus fijiensis CBS 313.89 TaxID=1448319 RepID=A0A8G1RME6_9EURO|nr:uncharacterized protein BO72DRAFT_170975 [Aspergillus fijiensis CBS 313.89]RAK75434.1 hypothetical protein BO72DRAFT_170975 [Aspergillus fijiensis CBS 313.89]
MTFLYALWLSIPFCQSTLIICKLSLLAFYQRIFTRRSVKRFGHFIATILIMCGVWIFFSSIFFCNPVSYFWAHGPTAKKHCLPWKILWTINGSIQIVSYLAILIVPLMVLPGLCLAKGQKIGLLSLFGLNLLLACAGMIHSVVTFKRFLSGNFTLVNANQDLVYSSSDATLSIVCACMPACYPVFRWIVTRLIIQNIPQKFKVLKEPTVPRNINLTSPIDDDSTFVASGHMYAASVQVTEGGGYHNKRQVGVIEVKRSVDIISQGDMGEWIFRRQHHRCTDAPIGREPSG